MGQTISLAQFHVIKEVKHEPQLVKLAIVYCVHTAKLPQHLFSFSQGSTHIIIICNNNVIQHNWIERKLTGLTVEMP